MAEGVNDFKDLTLVFENSATCPLVVLTDMPGGVMGAGGSVTINLPVTTVRTEKTFPFDTGASLLEGKLIKFTATPAGVLKIYSGFVRFRRIGEYIDGTQGDRWQTLELSLSP
jgi:hypothetical protein